MLDHVFTHLVSAHRDSFESALLQRQAVEERFQVDVFLGDVSFETSYSLPGEERPARIRVDTSLDWPTWSQTAYRSWAIGDDPEEPPEVLVEIAFRVQGLDRVPDAGPLLATLPGSLEVLGEPLVRGPATIEQMLLDGGAGRVRRRGGLRGVVRHRRGHPGRPRHPGRGPRTAGSAGRLAAGPHRRPPLHLPTGGSGALTPAHPRPDAGAPAP